MSDDFGSIRKCVGRDDDVSSPHNLGGVDTGGGKCALDSEDGGTSGYQTLELLGKVKLWPSILSGSGCRHNKRSLWSLETEMEIS